jgi:hypothetical protein
VRLHVVAPLEPQPTVHDQHYQWCNLRQCLRRTLDCDNLEILQTIRQVYQASSPIVVLFMMFWAGMCARGAVHWPVLHQQPLAPRMMEIPDGLFAKSRQTPCCSAPAPAPHLSRTGESSEPSTAARVDIRRAHRPICSLSFLLTQYFITIPKLFVDLFRPYLFLRIRACRHPSRNLYHLSALCSICNFADFKAHNSKYAPPPSGTVYAIQHPQSNGEHIGSQAPHHRKLWPTHH